MKKCLCTEAESLSALRRMFFVLSWFLWFAEIIGVKINFVCPYITRTSIPEVGGLNPQILGGGRGYRELVVKYYFYMLFCYRAQ